MKGSARASLQRGNTTSGKALDDPSQPMPIRPDQVQMTEALKQDLPIFSGLFFPILDLLPHAINIDDDSPSSACSHAMSPPLVCSITFSAHGSRV
jgi:hypothetical protein